MIIAEDLLCQFEWQSGPDPLMHACSRLEGHSGPHKCGFVNCGMTHDQLPAPAGQGATSETCDCPGRFHDPQCLLLNEQLVNYVKPLPAPSAPAEFSQFELLQVYRSKHKECVDLTGNPDALKSMARDWRCDLCKQVDLYSQPVPPAPPESAEEAWKRAFEHANRNGWISNLDEIPPYTPPELKRRSEQV